MQKPQRLPQQSAVRRYACAHSESIRYRLSKFEFLLLLNKADASDADSLIKMMRDYDFFLEELGKEHVYLSTLSKSVVINMSECFEKMKVGKISAKTGFGFDELPKLTEAAFQPF